jgi:two-component system sensor histidine kinase DesK
MTSSEPECRPTGNKDLKDIAQLWGGNWGRFLFPGFWLVYLGQTISGVAKHSHGWGSVAGYVIVGAFAFCYLAALNQGWWKHTDPVFWGLYCLGVGLTVAELFFAHGDALVFCIYLSVLAVAARSRFSPALVAMLTIAVAIVPKLVFDRHTGIAWSDALTVVLIAIAMYGFFQIIESNVALSAARAEVARLAAENERSRIARNLHDLLGHSLTAITVKAGLARRLAERGEFDRAAQEVGEVEQLSRRTLVEVRAAVSGYREVTLSGELASAREVLRAAGMDAELPGAIDSVDADAAPLFGWVVREGVTNIVRHSRARLVTITLGPRWIEIVDDGRGGAAGAGNGLTGLRERLAAHRGTLAAGGCSEGWRLRAELAPLAVNRDAATISG